MRYFLSFKIKRSGDSVKYEYASKIQLTNSHSPHYSVLTKICELLYFIDVLNFIYHDQLFTLPIWLFYRSNWALHISRQPWFTNSEIYDVLVVCYHILNQLRCESKIHKSCLKEISMNMVNFKNVLLFFSFFLDDYLQSCM